MNKTDINELKLGFKHSVHMVALYYRVYKLKYISKNVVVVIDVVWEIS